MCKTGNIFNIQRFSTVDGPGIRTVVFFKGCPLDCAWCHNPESKSCKQEVFYKQALCIGCGGCAQVCPAGAHSFAGGIHRYHRENCQVCGKCTAFCPANALELCGSEKTDEEILTQALRDLPFYGESGGGITLSGGEPLMQFDFVLRLLQRAKTHGLHTAIETCGYTHRDLALLHPVTDLWLYDIKLLDDADHRRYTGVSNGKILENLRLLDALGANIVLRCPIIPGVNLTDAHFHALAALADSLQNVQEIHLEPYHPLGISKAQQLGKTQAFSHDSFLDAEALAPFAATLQANTKVAVRIA